MVTGSRVLCATAGTDRDAVLIQVAGALARRTRRALDVLHVQPPVAVTAAGPGSLAHPPLVMPADDSDEARRRLVALAGDVGDNAACEVVRGAPRVVLQERSHDADVAWLVVGDRGRGALRSALEGSITRHLLAVAGCPLLIVPEGADARGVDESQAIVCAVGDDAAAASRVTAVGDALARDLASALLLVHVVHGRAARGSAPDRGGEIGRVLDRCLSSVSAELDARPLVVAGEAPEAVARVAAEERGGIVVVGCPSHGPLRSALGRSVAHGLLARLGRQLAVVVPGEAG